MICRPSPIVTDHMGTRLITGGMHTKGYSLLTCIDKSSAKKVSLVVVVEECSDTYKPVPFLGRALVVAFLLSLEPQDFPSLPFPYLLKSFSSSP